LAVPLREPAVAHVERALAVAQVAQNVRSRFAPDKVVQFSEGALAGRIAGGIDGGELAAGPSRGVLRVPEVQGQRAAEKLERQLARHAVVKEPAEHPFRIAGAGGHVDLPARGWQRAAGRNLHLPLAE